jgi:hypothetical protein
MNTCTHCQRCGTELSSGAAFLGICYGCSTTTRSKQNLDPRGEDPLKDGTPIRKVTLQ